jgi:hypothetical protein
VILDEEFPPGYAERLTDAVLRSLGTPSLLPYEQTVGIATDAPVRITAQMKTSVSNAGVTKITYEATSVERLDGDQPSQ